MARPWDEDHNDTTDKEEEFGYPSDSDPDNSSPDRHSSSDDNDDDEQQTESKHESEDEQEDNPQDPLAPIWQEFHHYLYEGGIEEEHAHPPQVVQEEIAVNRAEVPRDDSESEEDKDAPPQVVPPSPKQPPSPPPPPGFPKIKSKHDDEADSSNTKKPKKK